MAVYPGAIATDADLYIAVNNKSTFITDNPLSAVATTVNVNDATQFPSVGAISIDAEIIHYTGKTATSFTGCVRAFDNTIAASHAVNTPGYHYVIADHHNVLKDEIKAIEAALGTNPSFLPLSGGTLSGNIAMGNNKLTGLAAGSANGDSLRYEQLIGVYLPLAGGTMTGDIAMSGTQKLTGLAAGTVNGDSVRYEQLLAWALDSTVVHNTGTENVAGEKTFTTQLIGKGTTTNNNAAAGFIGEYVESSTGPVNAAATATWGDATSISLTAGDWDVDAIANWGINNATWSRVAIGISTTSGNSAPSTLGSNYVNDIWTSSATTPGNVSQCISRYRISLASTTTVYYKIRSDYSAGTPQIYCRLSARRVR